METTPLGRSPLLALPAQPREKQPLQRVDLQKQSVGLQTLSLATMELSATPMPTQKLKPMKPSSPRVSRETTAKSKQSINDRTQAPAAQGMSVAYLEYHSRTIGKTQSQSVVQDAPIAHLQPSGPSMPLVSERRLPLLGQYIELHPIAAVQHPVARRKSRLKRK
ncbi:MAG: hypothetical protein DBY11_02160 [Eggerthellales bacterium]|nr:MAG: hypothetical protein DBY11_02160 [Eggerthellales bacterium]